MFDARFTACGLYRVCSGKVHGAQDCANCNGGMGKIVINKINWIKNGISLFASVLATHIKLC